MDIITSVTSLRDVIAQWRKNNDSIAFVPTMGNLHEGHLRLVDVAHAQGKRVVVSIFVNPLQFSPGTDFENYPRTLSEDEKKLQQHDVDLLFAPSLDEMTGGENETLTSVKVDQLSNILCGLFRPGHFEGVTTIVARLFNLVQPDVAVFGEKDFQQLVIIRKMVQELCFPVKIVGVPTVREAGQLAMSSRNQYLEESQRDQASLLYETLLVVKQQVLVGELSFADIESAAMDKLVRAGFRPDYVSLAEPENLQPGCPTSSHLRVLAAAWLGEARLIDNVDIR